MNQEYYKWLTKVFAYLRTSGEINPDDSIDVQKRFVSEYAKEQEIEITEFLIDEKKTGLNQNREAFQRLKHLVDGGLVELIIVPYFDRLGRNDFEVSLFLMQVKKKGIECISVGEGKKLSQMSETEIVQVAISADVENRNRTERLQAGKREVILKGVYPYSPPLGYSRNENRILILNDDAPLIKEIFNKYLDYKSISKLRRYLNNNPKWSSFNLMNAQLHVILRNKTYTGYIYQFDRDKKLYERLSEVPHPAIISESLFEKTQRILEVEEKRPGRKRKFHLFSGLLYCPNCKSKLILRSTQIFYCSVEKWAFAIKEEEVEPALLSFVAGLGKKQSNKINKQKIEELRKEQEKLELQYATLKISKDRLKERLFQLNEQMKKAYMVDQKIYDQPDYRNLIKEGKFKELKELMKRNNLKIVVYKESETNFSFELLKE